MSPARTWLTGVLNGRVEGRKGTERFKESRAYTDDAIPMLTRRFAGLISTGSVRFSALMQFRRVEFELRPLAPSGYIASRRATAGAR